jgi:hypothetical protein
MGISSKKFFDIVEFYEIPIIVALLMTNSIFSSF